MRCSCQYAAENLAPLTTEHFLARKATELAAIKNLTREDPVAVVRNILESLDGKATAQQIGEWLIGESSPKRNGNAGGNQPGKR
jgi:transcription elongation factor GreA-like protein